MCLCVRPNSNLSYLLFSILSIVLIDIINISGEQNNDHSEESLGKNNYNDPKIDALAPFVIRVIQDNSNDKNDNDTIWSDLIHSSSHIASEVSCGSGIGLPRGSAVTIKNTNCDVIDLSTDYNSNNNNIDCDNATSHLRPFLVSGLKMRREAEELKERKRKVEEEEKERHKLQQVTYYVIKYLRALCINKILIIIAK